MSSQNSTLKKIRVALGLVRALSLNAALSAGASGPPIPLPSTLAPPSPGSPATLPRASTPCGLSGLNLRSASSMLTKPLQGLSVPVPPVTPTLPPGGKDREAFEAEYRLGPLLGKGGFGTVFAGHRVTDRLQVAIKVIPTESCAWLVPFVRVCLVPSGSGPALESG